MRKNQNSFIMQRTPDQTHGHEALAEQIRDAQESAVAEQLSNNQSGNQLRFVVDEAANFAEAVTQKYLAPDSPSVACKDGCSWCCYQLVQVSAPEVFRIVRHLNSDAMTEIRTTVVGRLRLLDKATRGVSDKGRANIPKSCAFLIDGKCSIYAVRPLTCAEFTSYDVVVCKRLGFKSGGVVHELTRMIAYKSVQQGLVDGLKKIIPKADAAWLELTAAVVQALDTPNTEAAWLSGENIFTGAHLGSPSKT